MNFKNIHFILRSFVICLKKSDKNKNYILAYYIKNGG